MLDLQDHASRHRRVRQIAHTADLVEPESDQGLALGMMAPLRAADLFNFYFLRCARHGAHPIYSVVASASTPWRRDCSADTLMLRRAATERGESWCLSASKVART